MLKFKKEMEFVKEITADLKLKEFNINFLTTAPANTDDEYILNGNVYGFCRKYTDDDTLEVVIMHYKMNWLLRGRIIKFIIAHELRHVWQHQNNFKFSSNYIPYEIKHEEIDANQYAMHQLKDSYIIQYLVLTGAAVGAFLLHRNKSK